MSPAISMSAIEILPALLDKSKTQSIRDHKKPLYKVGDKVKIYWKMRSKANAFCKKCGAGFSLGVNDIPTLRNSPKNSFRRFCNKCNSVRRFHEKLLGTVEITEVFEITMEPEGFVVIHSAPHAFINEIHAKADGFSSAKEMFEYFNKNYELPRRFAVYRWKWL